MIALLPSNVVERGYLKYLESSREASSSVLRNSIVNSTTDPSGTAPQSAWRHITWQRRHAERRLRICTPSRFTGVFHVDRKQRRVRVWSSTRRQPVRDGDVCRRRSYVIESFDDRYVSHSDHPEFVEQNSTD